MQIERDKPNAVVEVDWSQVTPYDVMRNQNCKTVKFLNRETYPSIRPPVSLCSNTQTREWLADAVEGNGCARPFGTKRDDDILEVWKQSPNKHTLAFYGILSEVPAPEAFNFNETMSKCLNKVNGKEVKKRFTKRKEYQRIPMKLKGPFVLNRCELRSKINQMPTVSRKLNTKNTLSWLHCPDPADPEFPFMDDDVTFPISAALDLKKPVRRKSRGLRRRHRYCEVQCGISGNKCTEYEWAKYKQDPGLSDNAFQMEMSQMEEQADPEPRNYDELYSHLIDCFQLCCAQAPRCRTSDQQSV